MLIRLIGICPVSLKGKCAEFPVGFPLQRGNIKSRNVETFHTVPAVSESRNNPIQTDIFFISEYYISKFYNCKMKSKLRVTKVKQTEDEKRSKSLHGKKKV